MNQTNHERKSQSAQKNGGQIDPSFFRQSYFCEELCPDEPSACCDNHNPCHESCCCKEGPKGDTGLQGCPGITGAQGSKGDKGDTGAQGSKGDKGDTGAQGSKGDKGDTGASCASMEQMKHILKQVILLYPTKNCIVTMDSGHSVSGRASALFPPPDSNPLAGLLLLTNSYGGVRCALSICKIASIHVTNSTYDSTFTFLPPPSNKSICGGICGQSMADYLPIGSAEVSLQSGCQTLAIGTILKNEFAILVVTETNNSNPTFVLTDKIETALFACQDI